MPIRMSLSAIGNAMGVPWTCAIALSTGLTVWAETEVDCPAPVATCTRPAAARHSAQIAAYFHTSGVVHSFTDAESECAEPIATCIRPTPQISRLSATVTGRHAEVQPTVAEILRGWATASTTHAAWSPAERQWLARRHQPWLSAVALDAVIRLSSSLTENELARDFNWTQAEANDEVTVLLAVPTEDMQRLFCPQLRVELDAITHGLTAIDVADRTGTWRPIDLPWAVLPHPSRGSGAIILTAERREIEVTDQLNADAAGTLPPSPQRLPVVRFAADVIEIEAATPR